MNDNLKNAMIAWANTYPDLNDAHNAHSRGRFQMDCPGCVAEHNLLTIAYGLADDGTMGTDELARMAAIAREANERLIRAQSELESLRRLAQQGTLAK